MVARVRDIIQRGTTAAKPAATAVDVGTLYFDTTLDGLYRSNGASWESVEAGAGTTVLYLPFAYASAVPPFSAAAVAGRIAVPSGKTVRIISADIKMHVSTTNTGANYWTATLNRVNSANTATSLGSVNTSADAVNTWLAKQIVLNADLDASALHIRIDLALTGAPGVLQCIAILVCTIT